MADTPEAAQKKEVNKLLAEYQASWVNYIAGVYTKSGVSDKLACVCGRFFAIEAKAYPELPTALQVLYLQEVHEAGGIALVINEKNLRYLEACLRDPAKAKSNFQHFISPSVREALEGVHDTLQPTIRKRHQK